MLKFRYYGRQTVDEDDDGEMVIYGPPFGDGWSREPSFSYWIVPGTAKEVEEDDCLTHAIDHDIAADEIRELIPRG